MTYELGKTYFYANRLVILKAVWYEDETTYAAVRYKDAYNQQLIVPLQHLALKKNQKKRVSISVELKPDNTLEVTFLNLALREQDKINFYQSTFDLSVEVENVEV